MKNSKEYSKEIKKLYRSLSRKYPKIQKIMYDEPVDAAYDDALGDEVGHQGDDRDPDGGGERRDRLRQPPPEALEGQPVLESLHDQVSCILNLRSTMMQSVSTALIRPRVSAWTAHDPIRYAVPSSR